MTIEDALQIQDDDLRPMEDDLQSGRLGNRKDKQPQQLTECHMQSVHEGKLYLYCIVNA